MIQRPVTKAQHVIMHISLEYLINIVDAYYFSKSRTEPTRGDPCRINTVYGEY